MSETVRLWREVAELKGYRWLPDASGLLRLTAPDGKQSPFGGVRSIEQVDDMQWDWSADGFVLCWPSDFDDAVDLMDDDSLEWELRTVVSGDRKTYECQCVNAHIDPRRWAFGRGLTPAQALTAAWITWKRAHMREADHA